MPEADTEDRQLARKMPDRFDRDARFVGRARPRRDDEQVGPALRNARDVYLVVAKNFDVGAELAEVLHQVVGEAVVVVDHEKFHSNPSSTSSLARSNARAFASVSFHSSSGTESATMPAAACTYSTWSLTMPVRIAI